VPTISIHFQAQVHGSVILAKQGFLVAIELRVPEQLEKLLLSENKPVPAPLTGPGLVDTGATFSMIDEGAVEHLCVSPVGVVTLGTAGGSKQSALYPVRLAIRTPPPNEPLLRAEFAGITAGPLKDSGLLCLIGRDILSRGVLVYDGGGGHVSLSL